MGFFGSMKDGLFNGIGLGVGLQVSDRIVNHKKYKKEKEDQERAEKEAQQQQQMQQLPMQPQMMPMQQLPMQPMQGAYYIPAQPVPMPAPGGYYVPTQPVYMPSPMQPQAYPQAEEQQAVQSSEPEYAQYPEQGYCPQQDPYSQQQEAYAQIPQYYPQTTMMPVAGNANPRVAGNRMAGLITAQMGIPVSTYAEVDDTPDFYTHVCPNLSPMDNPIRRIEVSYINVVTNEGKYAYEVPVYYCQDCCKLIMSCIAYR